MVTDEEEIKVSIPPITAIEIISPSQSQHELIDKCKKLLQYDVKSVWLLQPDVEIITLFLPGERPQSFDRGEFTDPVTGIAFNISEVFA